MCFYRSLALKLEGMKANTQIIETPMNCQCVSSCFRWPLGCEVIYLCQGRVVLWYHGCQWGVVLCYRGCISVSKFTFICSNVFSYTNHFNRWNSCMYTLYLPSFTLFIIFIHMRKCTIFRHHQTLFSLNQLSNFHREVFRTWHKNIEIWSNFTLKCICIFWCR